jgi:predicted lactoylglutathione lyase
MSGPPVRHRPLGDRHERNTDMRMIFVNLPITSVSAARAFWSSLGFGFNETFCSDDTLCLMIAENIFAMLLEKDRFRSFVKHDLVDNSRDKEVLIALSCDSKEAVQALKAKALAAGGQEWMPVQDYGFMYGDSFLDLDGHVWEIVWMDPAAAEAGDHKDIG